MFCIANSILYSQNARVSHTAACVCTSWRAAVASCPELWRDIDLSSCRHVPHSKFAANLPQWHLVQNMSLSGCSLEDSSLRLLADYCLLLESLDLSFTKNFTKNSLSVTLCSMLQRVAGPHSRPLRSLNLSGIIVSSSWQYAVCVALGTAALAPCCWSHPAHSLSFRFSVLFITHLSRRSIHVKPASIQ